MKRMLKIVVAAVFVIILGAVILTACSGNRLVVWCAEQDKELIQGMVDEFLAANPKVKGIDVKICEDNKTRDTFLADKKAAADVICAPHDQIGELVSTDNLLEITGADHIAAIKKNSDASIAAGQFGGKQYGFPSSFETLLLFYDRSLLSSEEVKTMEGIFASAKITGDNRYFGTVFNEIYYTASFFFTYGCLLFGEDGTDNTFCDFNSEGGYSAMSYIIDNKEKFTSVTANNGDANEFRDDALQLFRENKLGAYIGGPWNARDIMDALGSNYGCAALPSIGGKPMKTFAGYKLYCVNKNTKNPEAALALAAWLTTPENQKERFLERDFIPVAKSLADDIDIAEDDSARAMMAQGANAIPMPSIPEMSLFWATANMIAYDCLSGDIVEKGLQSELDLLAAAITADKDALIYFREKHPDSFEWVDDKWFE